MRCYVSVAYAIIVSVCPSVARRHCTKQLNLGSRKQLNTIAHGLKFSDVKDLGEIPTRSPPTRALNRDRVGLKVTIFNQYLGWLHGTVVERRSLAGVLSPSCARPVADG